MAREAGRLAWDERHRAGDFERPGANPTLTVALEATASAAPGRAIELAAGSGANAVWLAQHGWRTTAVDWSPVALKRGRRKAREARVEVEWLERDLLQWAPPVLMFDLVVIVYLHLPPGERGPAYARAAAAVAPGGRLVIVGHDRTNASEGAGGPPDPALLFTAAEVAAELLAVDPELELVRAEVVRQVPPPGRGPIDALLVVRRPADDAQ